MATLQQVHVGSAQKPAVIFVHGLGGHPVDTWRHSECSNSDCWPHWVGQDTDCDTWLLDYDAGFSAWRDQAMPLPDQSDQVLDLLDVRAELRGRGLILIGHSMGGLVIKTLVVRGRTKGVERFRRLVERVRGVVFIATPHVGAHLANVARAARWVFRTNVHVGNLKLHDPHLRELNQEFRHAVNDMRIEAHPIAERRGVRIGPRVFGLQLGPRLRIVNDNSADPGLPGIATIPMAGDHIDICKPKDRQQHIHLSVCEFIDRLQRSHAQIIPAETLPDGAAVAGTTKSSPSTASSQSQTWEHGFYHLRAERIAQHVSDNTGRVGYAFNQSRVVAEGLAKRLEMSVAVHVGGVPLDPFRMNHGMDTLTIVWSPERVDIPEHVSGRDLESLWLHVGRAAGALDVSYKLVVVDEYLKE